MAARTVNKLNKKVERRQDKTFEQIDAFLDRLYRFLDVALEEIVGELQDGNKDPAIALGGFLDQLDKRGFKKKMTELGVIYGKQIKEVRKTFKDNQLKSTIGIVNKEALESLVTLNVEALQTKSANIIGDIRPKILESTILGQKIDLRALKKTLSSKIYNQVKTEVNQSLNTFYRTATVLQAKNLGLEKFLYVGPDDNVTRPFCSQLLERQPPIYTIKEIEAMDNGQGLDVLTNGGGWNCRHEWTPVSDELEKELKGEGGD